MSISNKTIYWLGRVLGQRFRNWYHKRTGRYLWGIIGYVLDNCDNAEEFCRGDWGPITEGEFDKWLDQISGPKGTYTKAQHEEMLRSNIQT